MLRTAIVIKGLLLFFQVGKKGTPLPGCLIVIFFPFLLVPVLALGQGTASAGSTKSKTTTVRSILAVNLSFDNDLYDPLGQGTDRYLTGGINLMGLIAEDNPGRGISKLFFRLKEQSNPVFYAGVSQKIYTPGRAESDEFHYPDRPYAATLYASLGYISYSGDRKHSLVSTASAGVMGPIALGKESHTGLHKLLQEYPVLGWDKQIANDLILNYSIRYGHSIGPIADKLEVSGFYQADLGLMKNSGTFGLLLMAGTYKDYYPCPDIYLGRIPQAYNGKRFFQFLFYSKPAVTAVVSDATLTGGIISRPRSEYLISRDSLKRIIGELEYGGILSLGPLSFSYRQHLRSPEYRQALGHKVSSLTIILQIQNRFMRRSQRISKGKNS